MTPQQEARRAAAVNVALVALAFALPRAFVSREDGLTGATAAAIRAYLASRRRGEPMPWTGLVPLGVCGLGLLVLVAVVVVQATGVR